MTLSPWESSNLVVEKSEHPFSNLYFCEINIEGTIYHSSEQVFYLILAKFYNQPDLANNIFKSEDPYQIQSFVKNHNRLFDNYLEERIMRFVIMQKFQQVEDFREELFNARDKCIIYKQINMDRNEEILGYKHKL